MESYNLSMSSTPDNQSNGMEYSFTCFRKLSGSCSLAAKADGKVDTKLTAYPPIVTLGMLCIMPLFFSLFPLMSDAKMRFNALWLFFSIFVLNE